MGTWGTSMQSLKHSSARFITSPKAPRAPTSPFATVTQPRQPFRQSKQSNRRTMATDRGELKIESQNIKTAPGVELSSQQQTLVGSVLDLFAGRPSLAKLGLWKDDAEFTDPLTVAKGREKYEAQWYGLQAVFSEIERSNHEVKSAGNPIVMDLSSRYVVKGLGKEQKINSVVEIHTEGDKIKGSGYVGWEAAGWRDFECLPSPQRSIRSKDGRCAQECRRGPPTRQPVGSFALKALTIALEQVCAVRQCSITVICIMNE